MTRKHKRPIEKAFIAVGTSSVEIFAKLAAMDDEAQQIAGLAKYIKGLNSLLRALKQQKHKAQPVKRKRAKTLAA